MVCLMTTPTQLERRIDTIKREIIALGPLRPGTLTQQYNVCGSPHCRCKADPPQKHGPYYQLSYTWQRKSRTHFVREEELPQVRTEVGTYLRLRSLLDEWINASLEIARLDREKRRPSARKSAKPRPKRVKLPRSPAK